MKRENVAGHALSPKGPFAGTATYYAQYRAPYPENLIAHLMGNVQRTRKARLLDLGCGAGRVAIPLASYFKSVWAVDPEPDMSWRSSAREVGTSPCTQSPALTDMNPEQRWC